MNDLVINLAINILPICSLVKQKKIVEYKKNNKEILRRENKEKAKNMKEK